MPENYGAITEQGFPAGQFGFSEVDKKTSEKIKKESANTQSNNDKK